MPMTSVCIILTTSVISSSKPKCVPVARLIVTIRKIFKVKPHLKLNNKDTFSHVYELIFSNHNPFSGMSNDFLDDHGKAEFSLSGLFVTSFYSVLRLISRQEETPLS